MFLQPDINPEIFRAFSIRGIADTELTDEVVTKIGRGIGEYFIGRGSRIITVGRDVRISSERISRALISAILETGLSILDVGVVPTPVLNFAADYQNTDGGVMITASHNPPDYNGFKVRTATTLDQAGLQEIYELAKITSRDDTKFGIEADYISFDPIPLYLEHIRSCVNTGTKLLKIVIDGNNGTNGPLVVELLRSLGHRVVELNCERDGNFPNGKPDPTAEGATHALSLLVQREGADIGFAYDGDGDRVVLVDELGQVIAGDQTLMVLTRGHFRNTPRPAHSVTVVYEVLCSQAVADDVIHHGGKPVMVPSGYFYVQKAMQEHNAVLGGELSGHFFFREPRFHFDDSILATIKMLNLLTAAGESLSQLVEQLPAYYSSPEIRLACSDSRKSLVIDLVKHEYGAKHQLETLDGVRIHFANGWALVRQSNTQPVISMRFEARSSKDLDLIQSSVQRRVKAYIQQTEQREIGQ
jgi:phosphomannomutase / phosphoglucomutase